MGCMQRPYRRDDTCSLVHSPRSHNLFPLVLLSILSRCPGSIAFAVMNVHPVRYSPGRSFSTSIAADLSFSGDSTASIKFDNAPLEWVQEWLDTPQASDLTLLGSEKVKLVDRGPPSLYECEQPRIDFMGLDLQPTFTHRVSRSRSGQVQVQVLDSRTDILSNSNPANQVVGTLMGQAKFSGESIISAKSSSSKGKDRTLLTVDLTLTLNVPLPPFVPLPPGFNTLGGSIIERTGSSRTKKLLEDLDIAYRRWAKSKQEAAAPDQS